MLSAAYESPTPYANCKRSEARTNMFVMAKLLAGGTSCTVKVRNMSAGGALVEGASLPTSGTPCILVRGDTSLEAHIIWLGAGKAGLNFVGAANVDDWLPNARKAQQEVDNAVAQAKAELAHTPRTQPPAPLPSTAISSADVIRTANALELLANDLAEEPAVIGRFMTRLQTLDISIQTLRKLAEFLPNPPRE